MKLLGLALYPGILDLHSQFDVIKSTVFRLRINLETSNLEIR